MTERIQLLDDLGAEFARVAAEAERTSPKPSRLAGSRFGAGLPARKVAVALSIAALLVGTAYSVPATRAAVDSIADSFAAWVSGDSDEAPGRALAPGDKVPGWFSGDGQARVIAKTDGVGLYARRTDSSDGPMLGFGVGEGVAFSIEAPLEWWRQRLGQRAVVPLGPAPFGPRDFLDERGRVPLVGVTTREVKRVELRYAEGSPSVGDTGDGGFVLLADAWRPVRELVAYDGSGDMLDRADMRGDDMRYLCDKEPGVCPPEGSASGR
jgi:hypothetical protein